MPTKRNSNLLIQGPVNDLRSKSIKMTDQRFERESQILEKGNSKDLLQDTAPIIWSS